MGVVKEGEKLYTLGNTLLLKRKMIAVVGSRQMSDYGRRMVEKIVPKLVNDGWVIVSGMALGVDAWAQSVCINNGGQTVAVLASGVDQPTPASNRWLYEKILKNNGLVVSEYKNGTEPNRSMFLARNRVIARLSTAVVVIEGRKQSGTLVTAKAAVEMGREVWAVPGKITDEGSFAPNYLIKNGAGMWK